MTMNRVFTVLADVAELSLLAAGAVLMFLAAVTLL